LRIIIYKRLLLYLAISFFISTIIGTISHEFGHYITARLLGFRAHMSYGMVSFSNDYKIMNPRQEFWLILAGPLQTMVTGTAGFLFLNYFSRQSIRVTFLQWAMIFLSLFWLRQSANFILWVGNYLFTGQFGADGDEVKLSSYFHLPAWVIPSITALIGFIVLAIVLFRFIPVSQRLTFILSGLIGGTCGYLFWLVYFGKIIMP